MLQEELDQKDENISDLVNQLEHLNSQLMYVSLPHYTLLFQLNLLKMVQGIK